MIANPQTVLALLPAASRKRLEELVTALQSTLGPKLSAVLVYGSAVRGGLTPKSDVDVLIVLTHDDTATLRSLCDPLGIARAAARIDCRLLTVAEIPRAADVFPVFYDDVRGCHAVLFGSDPFKDLVVHDEHRRLRVEQELRDARVRLRRLIVDVADDDVALQHGLERKLKAVRAPLASLLQLHRALGHNDDLVTVLDLLGRRYDVDTTALTTTRATTEMTTTTADVFAALLDKAIDDVDRLGADPHRSVADMRDAARSAGAGGAR